MSYLLAIIYSKKYKSFALCTWINDQENDTIFIEMSISPINK